jgi:phosphoribosylformylglycinamidine cyclo-ligase
MFKCVSHVSSIHATKPLCVNKKITRRTPIVLSSGTTYKHAGVNIDNGNEFVRRITKLNPTIGGFSGFVPFHDSLLVASTDGVGTKLNIATAMDKHDTIGIDLVAMSVNDIITCGAKPIFFLDYLATGSLDVDVAEIIIKGISEGCKMSDCVLLGGETAEMPGFYRTGDYDLAGFAVGSVKKDEVIDGKDIKENDFIIGIPSSGVHANGFSLVRKVLSKRRISLESQCSWSNNNETLGVELLTPTRIYVKDMLHLASIVNIKGMSHITGGGMTENIPRMFKNGSGLGVHIMKGSWEVPEVFKFIQKVGYIREDEMRRVFNMGMGMVLAVSEEDVGKVFETFPDAAIIGMVVPGSGVTY